MKQFRLKVHDLTTQVNSLKSQMKEEHDKAEINDNQNVEERAQIVEELEKHKAINRKLQQSNRELGQKAK